MHRAVCLIDGPTTKRGVVLCRVKLSSVTLATPPPSSLLRPAEVGSLLVDGIGALR
jgi:hypothetical protein